MLNRRQCTLLGAASAVLGSSLFFLASCIGGMLASASLLSHLDARDLTRQEPPHEPFFVLVVSTSDGRIEPMTLRDIEAQGPRDSSAGLLLPTSSGALDTGEWTHFHYRVERLGDGSVDSLPRLSACGGVADDARATPPRPHGGVVLARNCPELRSRQDRNVCTNRFSGSRIP